VPCVWPLRNSCSVPDSFERTLDLCWKPAQDLRCALRTVLELPKGLGPSGDGLASSEVQHLETSLFTAMRVQEGFYSVLRAVASDLLSPPFSLLRSMQAKESILSKYFVRSSALF